jgi:hypothetical protein
MLFVFTDHFLTVVFSFSIWYFSQFISFEHSCSDVVRFWWGDSSLLFSHLIFYNMIYTFFFFFYCCVEWEYIVALKKTLTMYQIYHTWIHPLLHSPLFLIPIPGIASTDIIFTFIYMCTQYLHHIHSPIPFLCYLPPSTSTDTPHPGTGPFQPSCSLIL